MLNLIARDWWVQLVRGIVAVLFGAVALLWPTATIQVLVVMIAVLAFADGLLALSVGLATRRANRRWVTFVVLGVVQIVFGVVVLVWPEVTALVLVYLVAWWSIIAGVITVIGAFRIRKFVRGEWVLALSGLAGVLFGVLLLIFPGSVAVAVVMTIGIFAIAMGVLLIVLSLRLRSVLNAST